MRIGEDILDTRDVDELIEELETELEDHDPDAFTDFTYFDDAELEEKYGEMRSTVEEVFEGLQALLSFKEELEGYCD